MKISYLGFKPQTIAVNGRSKLEVKLVEDAANLGEVVVVGYGTMDKKELTSAVSYVSAKDFTRVASVDPSMMIQGKVPAFQSLIRVQVIRIMRQVFRYVVFLRIMQAYDH